TTTDAGGGAERTDARRRDQRKPRLARDAAAARRAPAIHRRHERADSRTGHPAPVSLLRAPADSSRRHPGRRVDAPGPPVRSFARCRTFVPSAFRRTVEGRLKPATTIVGQNWWYRNTVWCALTDRYARKNASA